MINFRSNQVRVMELDGQPWFVSTDVCRALGMDLSRGAYKWLRGIRDDEKRLTTYGEIDPQLFCGAMSGRGGFRPGTQVTLVSESGLYKLILRSNKPEAEAFKDWVTREVLPAIRKDGGYILGEEKVRSGENLGWHLRNTTQQRTPRTRHGPRGGSPDEPSPQHPIKPDRPQQG